MGIQGRRLSTATIERIIAMRADGIPHRTVADRLAVSLYTVWAYATRKAVREYRRAREAAARRRYQTFCEELNRRAEEAKKGGGGPGNVGWLAGER